MFRPKTFQPNIFLFIFFPCLTIHQEKQRNFFCPNIFVQKVIFIVNLAQRSLAQRSLAQMSLAQTSLTLTSFAQVCLTQKDNGPKIIVPNTLNLKWLSSQSGGRN